MLPDLRDATSATEVNNALILQKEAVLELVHYDELQKAKNLLDLLDPLWSALGYAYKAMEARATIKDRAEEMIANDEEAMKKVRRNTEFWRDTNRRMLELKDLVRVL